MSNTPIDRIVVENLGTISNTAEHKVKFILLENGVLLFGKVEWHKDLMNSYTGEKSSNVVAAGSIPEFIDATDLSEMAWGGWKSTGYNVLTPLDYRVRIMEALLPYKKEIEGLLN